MQCIIGYTNYGVDLDITQNSTQQEKIDALLRSYGGPQATLDKILKHIVIIKENIKEIDVNDDRSSS